MQITGIHLKSNKEEVISALAEQLPIALEEIGLVAEGYASLIAPVDTGRLRSSISHATTESEAIIGTNVDYAPYVELGTSKMNAQPFLRPAIEEHIDEYQSILERNLSQ